MIFLFAISPITLYASAPRYEAILLVRYVLETDQIPYLTVYWAKVRSGSLVYDNEYRHPFHPPGPTPIDCTNTRRIGVTFVVNRFNARHLEHVSSRYVWTHSNVKSSDEGAMWTDTHTHSRVFHMRQKNEYYSSGLTLKDELRVNGNITVRVIVGGKIVLENVFSLSNCE